MEWLETKTDIGLIREQNEDKALSIMHPKNKKIKLLIVADGMGGRNHGEIASNFVVDSIKNWFLKKETKVLQDVDLTEKLLRRYIKSLNTNLIKKYGEDYLGTTLTLALVTDKKTLILNVGDSRAYIYQKKQLIQITEDDSDVWMYYKYGAVKKDDLRYFSNNSIINACIGICKELCTISSTIISNDYELILLLTDGVTDMITDRKIKSLINRTKKEDLLETIIYEAVYKDQKLKIPLRLKRKYLANYIVPFPGRDNATGAIYIKKV